MVAAILTLLGYSANDTIIIFDRVRENLRKMRKGESLWDLLDRSINETLPRSIMTHATTLASTLALLLVAGEVIRPFAWVMAFGVFVATFSSIYVAGPILMYMETRFPREDVRGRRSGHAGGNRRSIHGDAAAYAWWGKGSGALSGDTSALERDDCRHGRLHRQSCASGRPRVRR